MKFARVFENFSLSDTVKSLLDRNFCNISVIFP